MVDQPMDLQAPGMRVLYATSAASLIGRGHVSVMPFQVKLLDWRLERDSHPPFSGSYLVVLLDFEVLERDTSQPILLTFRYEAPPGMADDEAVASAIGEFCKHEAREVVRMNGVRRLDPHR